jgi:hypothetical protein
MAKVRRSPLEVDPDREDLAARHIDRLAAAMVPISASRTSASAGKSPALQATFLPRRHNSLFGFGRGIANKTRNVVHWGLLLHPPIRKRRPAYLEKLNPEQRRAVEHGVRVKECAPAAPLLVIAGAGSGKTNTLAHRVAHLIVNGADPRRILLMTFSLRAAGEMARRVERICAQAMGANAGVMTDALAWAGTFHGIGARILRDYAEQIGLDPNFTIHDREDSACSATIWMEALRRTGWPIWRSRRGDDCRGATVTQAIFS